MKDKAGKMPKSIAGRPPTVSTAPNKGQIRRPQPPGATNPATDGGGGMGNSSAELHRRLFGKK